ncbi:hypothetical protein BDV28DRAFT_131085 [Aspergillus coremiiformis]|uniref:Uncharacterized protein n=1 Tax=Aspergillus coremiiformis TaxID=138285 RepID=A0A5N6Z9Y1_9EURO|nr:hypothetical protein BDV28DRAFT_131085 [Aspergillus coremiiformis]
MAAAVAKNPAHFQLNREMIRMMSHRELKKRFHKNPESFPRRFLPKSKQVREQAQEIA